ncbi:MAG: hypothetical protein U0V72_00600 [Cytophagales bacterium]
MIQEIFIGILTVFVLCDSYSLYLLRNKVNKVEKRLKQTTTSDVILVKFVLQKSLEEAIDREDYKQAFEIKLMLEKIDKQQTT